MDIDGDGLSDNWELRYFEGIFEEPEGDFDGDGLTNLMEYQQPKGRGNNYWRRNKE